MAIQLRRRTVLRIQLFAWYAVVYSAVGLCWELIEEGVIEWGPIIGLSIGVGLAALEESRIVNFTRSMSFTRAVLVKSLVYLAVIAIPSILFAFIDGLIYGKALADFVVFLFDGELFLRLVIIFPIHVVVVFFRHLNRLLGPNTLLRYVSGKYHHPRVEKRVFMFLDLKSSTMLAETMGGELYFSFLNTFFRDISEPILERGAEIYQYIGDEVVLTWPAEVGLRDANCIRVFIEILAEIHSRRDYYLSEFDHVPEFKAGVHFGDVITAEIGDIKREIVYNGDVLNTTARIQSMCNQFDQILIASEALVSALELPEFIEPRSLGDVAIRGKAEPIPLVALV
ncbi:MAG: adenylate/guanylate cyclase domain-containing protein [Bacteroidetes bacterium]|nr:adenylate/guanylate cyclase domain-containing protein [Bacteroidota bacterium]